MADQTYEQLVSLRRQEWLDAQRRAGQEHAAIQASLQAMPDLVAPPSPWDTKGAVICACGAQVFDVLRWTTLNGHRYRAELTCAACRFTGTWDFGRRGWLR